MQRVGVLELAATLQVVDATLAPKRTQPSREAVDDALAANLKKYVAAYSRGLPQSAAFRAQALECDDLDRLLRLTRDYFGGLEQAA